MARTIRVLPSIAPKKKVKRASSIDRCIHDAHDFLLPRKAKKIVKTRTMVRTIQDAHKILHPSPVVKKANRTTKTAIRKKPVGKSRPAVPSAPAAVLPVSAGTTLIRAASLDKSIRPSKATIFKAASKDNLPIPAFGFIDVCFCVDATGSMCAELAQVQSTIVSIIEKIQSKVRTEGITLRFAIVTYRDHPPQQLTYVTEFKDFTDAHEATNYVNTLTATGGGDEPEAVHDGLIDSCQKLNWVEVPGTPILRYIFHIADAAPHGRQFLNGETKEGCLCGKTTAQVIHQINLRQIHYRLIKVRTNSNVNEMQRIFKSGIVNFDSASIVNAKEMDVRVSDMIIHEMLPQA